MRPARRVTRLALLVAVALTLPAPAAAQKHKAGSAYGEYVKAARLLGQWRYDDARTQIDAIAAKWPTAAETRYLKAELAFIEGDYPKTLEHLDGLDGGALQGEVGRLRALTASTLSVTDGFARRESSGGHFEIFYPPGKEEVIVDLAGDVLESAYKTLAADLGFVPTSKVRVELLTSPRDLAKLSPLSESEIETTGTIALCKYGKLMVVSPRATVFGYPWMDTLVHEYVHYAVSSLSHDEVPVWLHEGLARFQQTRWRTKAGIVLSVTDEHLLATALKKRTLIPFKDMHPSMAKLPSAEAATLAFAEVYTMVGYIYDKVGYQGIREIISKQRGGKSAQRAVGEVLGQRWSQVEQSWQKHLRGSKLETSKAFAARARGPRVRFNKGSGSDENVGADEVAAGKARKFTQLGGMLRARGMPDAAAIEYEKALAAAPGDPFVAGKLSRTYLELGKPDKAITLALPLAAADDSDPVPATTLGLAYGATGDAAKSAQFLEIALRVSPFDPAVRCGLADAYQSLGKSPLAARERSACTTLRQ
ncbi:MAG TPA: tetratricopeptide repeat protein [Kofleriaceae bacterium]|nr:tetratricopeptide repeat protein [Kofleriaceae bacterium]